MKPMWVPISFPPSGRDRTTNHRVGSTMVRPQHFVGRGANPDPLPPPLSPRRTRTAPH